MSAGDGTLQDALARAAAGPRGVTLLGQREGERRLPWSRLRERAREAAGALAAAGARPGDRLLLVLPTSEDWLALFLGAIALGAIPCPVSPPQGFGVKAAFAGRIAALARVVLARAIVTDDDGAAVLLAAEGAEAAPCEVWTATRLRGLAAPGGEPPRAAPEDAAFVQFTSGTTETSRGVVLPHRAVLANVAQLGAGAGIHPGSVIVSWLPLFHDMGLVGGLLTALARDVELVLSSPFGFLRRPASWLEAIGRFRGTHSPAPTFAYRAVLERLDPAAEARLDLSSWRVAFVGAETVPAPVLEAFRARLAPRGLGPDVLMPCYGLAEASLAVTFAPPGRRFATRVVGRRALATEGRVAAPDGPADARTLVSCGRPLEGTTLTIEDEAGRALAPGREGEVVVRGPSLFAGYFGAPPRGPGAPLRTGDLGFVEPDGPGAGELVITGRRKELVILRGENHAPAEIEWVAARVPGVREGKVAAFGVEDPAAGTEALAIVVEVDRRAGAEPGDLAQAVRRAVLGELGLPVTHVSFVGPGALPITTSGKVQRARARSDFLLRAAAGEASS